MCSMSIHDWLEIYIGYGLRMAVCVHPGVSSLSSRTLHRAGPASHNNCEVTVLSSGALHHSLVYTPTIRCNALGALRVGTGVAAICVSRRQFGCMRSRAPAWPLDGDSLKPASAQSGSSFTLPRDTLLRPPQPASGEPVSRSVPTI
jgi:hypothetical protein